MLRTSRMRKRIYKVDKFRFAELCGCVRLASPAGSGRGSRVPVLFQSGGFHGQLLIALVIAGIYALYFAITCRIACSHVLCCGDERQEAEI